VFQEALSVEEVYSLNVVEFPSSFNPFRRNPDVPDEEQKRNESHAASRWSCATVTTSILALVCLRSSPTMFPKVWT